MDAQTLIFVLGMHRSGTSVLTRALSVFGVDIGSHHLGRADNPRGFFEDPAFVRINEALLGMLGLSWDSLKPLRMSQVLGLADSDAGRSAASYLAGHAGRAGTCGSSGMWGIKDPRATILFPFWAELVKRLGIQVRVLISLRHPVSVAESLNRRDAMPLEKGIRLWMRYLSSAVCTTYGFSRMFVSYEQMMQAPGRGLDRLGTFLGRTPDQEAYETFVRDFLDPALQHHRNSLTGGARQKVLQEALSVYGLLVPRTMTVADDGTGPGNERIQDALRQQSCGIVYDV